MKKSKNKSNKTNRKKIPTKKIDLALEVATAINNSVVAISKPNPEVVPSANKTPMMRRDPLPKVKTDSQEIRDVAETIVETTTAVTIKEEKPTLNHGLTNTSIPRELDSSVLK